MSTESLDNTRGCKHARFLVSDQENPSWEAGIQTSARKQKQICRNLMIQSNNKNNNNTALVKHGGASVLIRHSSIYWTVSTVWTQSQPHTTLDDMSSVSCDFWSSNFCLFQIKRVASPAHVFLQRWPVSSVAWSYRCKTWWKARLGSTRTHTINQIYQHCSEGWHLQPCSSIFCVCII